MPNEQLPTRSEIFTQTAEIVAAHLANRAVEPAAIPALIQSIFDRLMALGGADGSAPTVPELTPAVPIRRSVTDAHIVCLEDGAKLKMLKRHLMTEHGMTPQEYLSKWGLKPDYPMVAPDYSRKRQELAKAIGLGRRPAPEREPAPKRRRARSKGPAA